MPSHSDDQLKTILETAKTIALVGASPKPERPSYRVMNYLLNNGFKVIPVNPGLAGKEILGQTVFGALNEIDEPVHMVDVFRNSEAAGPVVDEAISIKADTVWLQEGVINHKAADAAEQAGLNVVMDLCTKKEHARLLA